MESQQTDAKIAGAEKRDGIDKKSYLRKGSTTTIGSAYPSSSSYTTAEEGFLEDGHHTPNGTNAPDASVTKMVTVDQLYARIHHLEDELAGKDAALLAVTQELEAVREMSCIDASIGPLPSNYDSDFKASVDEYNRKLQEHASALRQRDEMIDKLADSLKQSVRDREELKTEAERLTQQVHSLQSQLHTIGQHVQQPQTKLLEVLKEKDAMLLKKSTELSQCKTQSSKEVQFLMSSLEELQQRAARSASSSPPASMCHDESNCKFAKELKDLRPCLDALNMQVKQLTSSKDLMELELASSQQKYHDEIQQLLAAQEGLVQELAATKKGSCEKLKELTASQELLEKDIVTAKQEHCAEVKQLISSKNQLEEKLASLEQKHYDEVKNLLSSQNDLQEELALLKQKYSDDVQELILSKDVLQQEINSIIQKNCNEVKVLSSVKECLEKDFVMAKQKHSEEVQELLSLKNKLEEELREIKLRYCADSKPINDQPVKEADMEVLIKKCQNDVKFLHSLFKSVNPSLQEKCDSNMLNGCQGQAHPDEDDENKTRLSGLTLLMTGILSHCEDLESKNLQLMSDMEEVQAKLEAEAKRTALLTKTMGNTDKICDETCACHSIYQEEMNLLKSTVESLQKEILEKDLMSEEKVKYILKKRRSSNSESEDNFINLINEYSLKAKEIILLQDNLKKTQLECQMSALEKERQRIHLKDRQSSLEEFLQKCCVLEETLLKTSKENSILQARLNRIECVYEYSKQNFKAPANLMWQLIEELASLKAAPSPVDPTKQQDNKCSIDVKMESVLKIINKMNVDCESLLVKVAGDDGNAALRSYLQSEALGLRRLKTSLLETEQAINSNSGPALQLHVNLLKQQLESKKLLYENICEAHYSLEAEMREMEEQFKQQEEGLQKELSQQKLASKLWQLKAECLQVQVESLKVVESPCEDRLIESFVKMDGAYSHIFNALHHEVERVASQRESKVKLEMAEKILMSERNHKEQLEELSRHMQMGSTVEALQLLHQQEIDAVRAECEYSSSKSIHLLQERLLSYTNQPPKVGSNDSCAEISLLLMKHNVSSQYNAAIKKINTNLQNELVQKLDNLEVVLRNICSSPDQEPDLNLPDDKRNLIYCTEELIQKAEEFGRRLVKMQREGLKTLLDACEENHKLLVNEIQRVTAEFVSLSDVKHLQEKLLRCKEEQRLALESLSASHKAEVSRLRLLLSQQNAAENPKSNETAMTVLRKELEEKHKRQMEELRTYFEQKCADFEKHYSEEVFSQHSRKLSDCSSTSESELVSEMYYAGPGSSNCASAGAPSYLGDLIGESSFKDLEESTPAVDLEKLFADNREQIETMRLALESRHQGELEAQKELYEVRVEELLRNMNESHTAELKFQSKRLQELQEKENILTKKLLNAEEEIVNLKEQLMKHNGFDQCKHSGDLTENHLQNQSGFARQAESSGLLQDKKTQLELEDELRRMSDVLKRRDSESSAQIASLKIKLRENHEVMSKLEKDLSNLQSKYSCETQTLTASINEKVRHINELNLKVEELSCKLKESNAQKTQLDSTLAHQLKKMTEEYDSKYQMKDQEYESKLNELQSKLAAKYAEDLLAQAEAEKKMYEERICSAVEEKKQQLDTEYADYLDFVKKCADDTKIQLLRQHEKEIAQTIEKYELELTALKNALKEYGNEESEVIEGQITRSLHRSLEDALKNERCVQESSISNCLQELFVLSKQLSEHQQDQLEKIIFKVCQEEIRCKERLHQDLEMRLDSVQKECERRFNLQLEEARSDIVQALERQIQQLLDDSTDVSEKPTELLQLEKKFASKYLQKLNNMQKDYETKISDLCKKHAAQISYARSKSKLANDVIITAEELDKVCKERDCLRNVAATLRDVVAELVRYFMSWEDDFNNTLMDELAKFETARDDEILSITQNEGSVCLEQSISNEEKNACDDDMPVIVATPARNRHLSTSLKRVHFAPDISGILSRLDDGSLLNSVGLNCSMRDASLNFQEELDRCLARLRSDSAALYALSKPALPSSTNFVPHHANDDNESEEIIPATVTDSLPSLEALQKENQDLQSQLEVIHNEYKQTLLELEVAQQRLSNLEQEARHQAEVVAEGYGEGEQSITCDTSISPRATSVEELQNKAKALLLGTRTSEVSGVVSPTSGAHLPHIVEELCREWERLAEESRHKEEDLQQQVDVADKQLKALRAFMDEQATERELERDEFVQEIKRLQEVLKDKDRDRSSQQHMNHEVETLESQLKESQFELKETQEKLEKLVAEHKQAVEKIWTLRDIISDLEVQVATKAEEAASVFAQNKALNEMVEQQGQTQLQLAQEMEELQMYADNRKLVEKIAQLEEQLRRHQVLAEQLGDPSAVNQMKVQLHDLSSALELHTRELECANASTAFPPSPCLSSPSEDVSIQETLEAMRAATEKSGTSQLPDSCPVLPFKEVSKVMDQWQKHARADDALLKKIRDLDMQLDDIQAEKHTLIANLQEQMVLTSSLQAKLDEHRRKADVKLSEATAEMQGQIEDLRGEIDNYMETLESREKQVQSLRSALQQAENSLRGREAEVRRRTDAERTIASQLQMQVSKLSADKAQLEAMLSEKDAMHVSLPALVESMLLDKNADIDRLEKQVHHLSKQMELSSYYVATPSTSLEFEYRESEQVRAHVALSPVLELQRSLVTPTINESAPDKSKVYPNDVSLPSKQVSLENFGLNLGLETEDSLKPAHLEETVPQQNLSHNSSSASDTLSSLANTFDTSLSSCERKKAALEEELKQKNKTIEDYVQQLNDNASHIAELELKTQHLSECEQKLAELSKLQDDLKAVMNELKKVTEKRDSDKAEFEQTCQIKDAEIKQLQGTIEKLLSEVPARPSDSAETPDQIAKSSEVPSTINELEDKESEIQRLKNEVCATQAILANLQRKVQEAKQIARSPSRSSPENHQVLRAVQSELETAKREIVELKDLCQSIRSEVELESLQKQAQFEKLLHQEQQTKQSLIEALEKVQAESMASASKKLEEDLKEAKEKEIQKDSEIQKLQSELKQLNMECITLRQQLHTPISQATALASRLDAEKKFADALKEELFLHKSRAFALDEECKLLKEQIADFQRVSKNARSTLVNEGNEKLLREVAELKSMIFTLQNNEVGAQKRIEKLLHDNTILQEENAEVGKELSDVKQLLIQLHGVKSSLDEAQALLESKNMDLSETRHQKDQLSNELRSLRQALKNLHGNICDYPDLSDEDRKNLSKIQRQLFSPSLRGAGDGPWNKLVMTETDVHEISPHSGQFKKSESLDDITDLVQHEVDVSVQLDRSLLQTIDPSRKKVGIISGDVQMQDTQERTSEDLYESNQCITLTSGPTTRIMDNVDEVKLHQLEIELNQMKAQYYDLQQQDCQLIKEMRIKLSEALDGQAALKLQLENELSKKQSLVVERNKEDRLSQQNLSLSPGTSIEQLQLQLIEATSQLSKLQAERDSTEKQLRRLQEVEVKRSHRRAEAEQKYRRHIEQLQTLHSQTQQECSMLRQELSTVNQKLQIAQEEFAKDRNDQLKNHTPFVERLKKMNTFLEEHIEENQRMAKQMEDLTEEHRRLRCRIAQLEGQLAERRNNESFETANARFAAERAEWEAERTLLLHTLNEAKQKRTLCGDSDVEDRVSHLFGRYLRMQSYRKALIWQKRYLLSVISGINESKSLAASHLLAVSGNSKENQQKSSHKFRSAVLVIIAIHRMKFMVERWLRGKRIGCGVVVQQTLSHTQFAFSSSLSGQGQQHLFQPSHLSQATEELRSSLSQSPPTLERPRQTRSHLTTSSQFNRFPLNSRGLGNTSSLSECVSSFNLAQQHFDTLLSNPPK